MSLAFILGIESHFVTLPMCKVFNTIGSLTTHLAQNKIDGSNSVAKLISFQESYASSRQQIFSNQEVLITKERKNLRAEILQLEDGISKSKSDVEHQLKSELIVLIQNAMPCWKMEKSFLQEFTYSFKIVYSKTGGSHTTKRSATGTG
jgi:hypothetical protein